MDDYNDYFGSLTQSVDDSLAGEYAYSFEDDGCWTKAIEYFSDETNFTTVNKKLAEIISQKFNLEFKNDDELFAFVKSRFVKNGVLLSQERTLKNWLKLNPDALAPTQRELAIKICFALDLTLAESKSFIEKSLYIRPFNFKSVEDAVYYFCLKSNLSFSEANDILSKVKICNQGDNKKETNIVQIEVDKITTAEDLINYIHTNSSIFCSNLVAAKRIFAEELEFAKSNLDGDATGRESVLTEIYGLTRSNKVGDKKGSPLVKYILKNLPNSQIFNNIANASKEVSEDAIRKSIIMLHFFNYFKEAGENSSATEFYDEINDCLEECSLPTLYPMNPYDAVIMMLAYAEDPLNDLQEFFGEALDQQE